MTEQMNKWTKSFACRAFRVFHIEFHFQFHLLIRISIYAVVLRVPFVLCAMNCIIVIIAKRTKVPIRLAESLRARSECVCMGQQLILIHLQTLRCFPDIRVRYNYSYNAQKGWENGNNWSNHWPNNILIKTWTIIFTFAYKIWRWLELNQ